MEQKKVEVKKLEEQKQTIETKFADPVAFQKLPPAEKAEIKKSLEHLSEDIATKQVEQQTLAQEHAVIQSDIKELQQSLHDLSNMQENIAHEDHSQVEEARATARETKALQEQLVAEEDKTDRMVIDVQEQVEVVSQKESTCRPSDVYDFSDAVTAQQYATIIESHDEHHSSQAADRMDVDEHMPTVQEFAPLVDEETLVKDEKASPMVEDQISVEQEQAITEARGSDVFGAGSEVATSKDQPVYDEVDRINELETETVQQPIEDTIVPETQQVEISTDVQENFAEPAVEEFEGRLQDKPQEVQQNFSEMTQSDIDPLNSQIVTNESSQVETMFGHSIPVAVEEPREVSQSEVKESAETRDNLADDIANFGLNTETQSAVTAVAASVAAQIPVDSPAPVKKAAAPTVPALTDAEIAEQSRLLEEKRRQEEMRRPDESQNEHQARINEKMALLEKEKWAKEKIVAEEKKQQAELRRSEREKQAAEEKIRVEEQIRLAKEVAAADRKRRDEAKRQQEEALERLKAEELAKSVTSNVAVVGMMRKKKEKETAGESTEIILTAEQIVRRTRLEMEIELLALKKQLQSEHKTQRALLKISEEVKKTKGAAEVGPSSDASVPEWIKKMNDIASGSKTVRVKIKSAQQSNPDRLSFAEKMLFYTAGAVETKGAAPKPKGALDDLTE